MTPQEQTLGDSTTWQSELAGLRRPTPKGPKWMFLSKDGGSFSMWGSYRDYIQGLSQNGSVSCILIGWQFLSKCVGSFKEEFRVDTL